MHPAFFNVNLFHQAQGHDALVFLGGMLHFLQPLEYFGLVHGVFTLPVQKYE